MDLVIGCYERSENMKKKSIESQIWIITAIIILSLSVFLCIVFFWTIRDFFTREVYNTIEYAQEKLLSRRFLSDYKKYIDVDEVEPNIRDVRHMIYYNGKYYNKIIRKNNFSLEDQSSIVEDASNQENKRQSYVKKFNGKKIFYRIAKEKVLGNDFYLISYMRDTYRNNLVLLLFSRVLIVIFVGLFIALIISKIWARNLLKPISKIIENIKDIGSKNLTSKVVIDREDEIGYLADSIEEMRKSLIEKDKLQQNNLQNVSHGLKTPVMVIRSYIQSIIDGVYPKGDLNESLQIIDTEAKTLEGRIKDLLYLNKIDYIKLQNLDKKKINIKEVIESVVDRLSNNRKDIIWDIDLENIEIMGDKEQWSVVVENIVENQIRYAKTIINITLSNNLIRFYNDGESIKEEFLIKMFKPFKKNKKGQFGLGLTIVKRILDLYNCDINVKNENKGVAFYIKFK